jgi:hypothetical protein
MLLCTAARHSIPFQWCPNKSLLSLPHGKFFYQPVTPQNSQQYLDLQRMSTTQ